MSRARVWWTPREIAKALGVTKWTVNYWIRQGLLKAIQPPRTVGQRVTTQDFEAFVRARMAKEAKGAAMEGLTVGWMRK